MKKNDMQLTEDAWLFTQYKLLFHEDRIRELKSTGTTFPVSFDIDLTNLCNHRCPHCIGSRNPLREDGGVDSTQQDFGRFKRLISEIKELGARSVGFAGGGDPSVYPHLAEALRYTKTQTLDIGMYTNGQVLREECLEAMIDCCTWIRISLDADGPEMYEKVHGVRGQVFFKVIENIKRLIEKRKVKQSNVTISTCFLIGPHTLPGVFRAAEISRELGVDYIRIRPYFQKRGDERTRLEVDETLQYLEKCKILETNNFKVYYPKYRVEWMDNKTRERGYKKCYAVHFMASVTPDGNVFPCCHMKDKPKMAIGNIKENSFKEIWDKESRRNISHAIDFSFCPNPCNYEQHNKLLWDIMESNQSLDDYLKENGLEQLKENGLHKNFL